MTIHMAVPVDPLATTKTVLLMYSVYILEECADETDGWEVTWEQLRRSFKEVGLTPLQPLEVAVAQFYGRGVNAIS